MAAFEHDHALRRLALWERQGYVGDDGHWQAARDELTRAKRWQPFNSDIKGDLGRLHEWRALQQRTTPDVAAAQHRQSVAHYQDAVLGRPSWGLAWANIAYNRAAGGEELDSVMWAFERALTFGSWDTEVQRRLAWIGISRWKALGITDRQTTLRIVRRALSVDHTLQPAPVDKFIVRTAVQFGWQDTLRPLLNDAFTEAGLRRNLDLRLEKARGAR